MSVPHSGTDMKASNPTSSLLNLQGISSRALFRHSNWPRMYCCSAEKSSEWRTACPQKLKLWIERRKHLQNFVFFFSPYNLNSEWLANSDICYFSSIHTSSLCSYLSVTTVNALLTCSVSLLAAQFCFSFFFWKHDRVQTLQTENKKFSRFSFIFISSRPRDSKKSFILGVRAWPCCQNLSQEIHFTDFALWSKSFFSTN